ncbi:MAG: hypothetical protein WD826_03955 [Actinomycetota bacterium]
MPEERRGFEDRRRFSLRDQATQFTIAGTLAALTLIAAIIGVTTGGSEEIGPAAGYEPGDVSVLAEEALKNREAPTTPTGDATIVNPSTRSAGSIDVGDPKKPVVIGTNEVVKVGIPYNSDPGAANAAAGFGGVGQIDQKRAFETMLKDINASAPFGRKLVPVWHPMTTDEIQSKGAERVEQEACARFTQDDPVFMVWDNALGLETLQTCLTKAKVPEVGGGLGLSYAKTYERFPYVLDPDSTGMDRMARFYIDQLVKAKFFSEFKDNAPPYTPSKPVDGKPRIGLIRYDQASWDAGAASLKSELKKHNLALCSGCEFEIQYHATDVAEQLNDATEVNAAIQQCKSRGCTHMLFLGSTAGVRIPLFFIDGAERQQYRPRLGWNGYDAPWAVRDFLGEASYPQLRDSRIVTWSPNDFEENAPAFNRCKELHMKAGESFEGEEGSNKLGQMSISCDAAWYTREVMAKAGSRLTLESFMAGAESIAPVDAVGTYVMQTKKGRHDGAGAIKVGAWNDGCACFKPLTGLILV